MPKIAVGLLSFTSALLAGLAPLPAQLQPAAPPVKVAIAPPQLLQQFDVMVGTLQVLQVPASQPNSAAIDVVLAGQAVVLDLGLFDVRAPNFQLLERGPNGLQPLPLPPCVTYRGGVRGEADSVVAATLVDGSLTAYVMRGSGELWLVQPVREVQPTAAASSHVVYRGSDSANLNVHCGVPGVQQGTVPLGGEEDVVYACQLALEADFPLFQLNGSNTTNTQNDVTTVVNAMDAIYRSNVQISLQVSQLIIDSVADPYSSNVANTLLTQFRNNWNATVPNTRDTAHLLTGRPVGASSGGTIGLAFVGVVCSTPNAYGLSQTRFTANFGYRVGVTAHEIGHNFNAAHCDASPPCNIMCSGIGGCANNVSSFSTGERAQIVAFRQTLPCLQAQATAPQITSATPLQIQTVNPVQVTLAGSGFTGVTSVMVGTATVTSGIQIVSDTQMRFTPPSGLPLGFLNTFVTNPAGNSNTTVLWYRGSDPCQVVVPGAAFGGSVLTWTLGGWENESGYLGISFVNTTSPFQGQALLDGFILLWMGALDNRGIATFAVPVPAGLLSGITVYSQMLDELPGTGTLRSLSTVRSTLIVF